jgi:hypothetical protein
MFGQEQNPSLAAAGMPGVGQFNQSRVCVWRAPMPCSAGARRDCRRSWVRQSSHRYSRYAKGTFRKDRRLTIRLSSKDLEAIQKRALAEGLPYQTLIASLLRKYATGRLRSALAVSQTLYPTILF